MSRLTTRTALPALAMTLVCLGAATVASAQTTDLLITEYVEGSGNNKALEISNGTEDVISLGGYSIDLYFNGSTTAVSIALAAVDLDPSDSHVLVYSQADLVLLALADQVAGNLNFNGNDALVLSFGGSQVIDSFGQVGFNPGSFWSCAEGNTANHTLRRVSGVCSGDVVPNDLFDPCVEYIFHASNTFSGLGSHIADCGAVAEEPNSWGA